MSILVENVKPIGHKSSAENAAPRCSPSATQKLSGIIRSVPRAEETRYTTNHAMKRKNYVFESHSFINSMEVQRMEEIDTFVRRCATGQVSDRTFDQGNTELGAIMMASDPWAMPVVPLMYGISYGLSALCLFDGGWRDALLAACLGVFTGLSALELDSMISPKLVKLNGFFSFEQLPRLTYPASFVPIH